MKHIKKLRGKKTIVGAFIMVLSAVAVMVSVNFPEHMAMIVTMAAGAYLAGLAIVLAGIYYRFVAANYMRDGNGEPNTNLPRSMPPRMM